MLFTATNHAAYINRPTLVAGEGHECSSADLDGFGLFDGQMITTKEQLYTSVVQHMNIGIGVSSGAIGTHDIPVSEKTSK